MAILKHISIKNSNYDAAIDYLLFQHDEFTNKAILDDNGRMIPREHYILDGLNCDPYSFGRECESTNAYFHKNLTKAEVKAHHYILSFDPRDRDENGLTPEYAQKLALEFASKNFSGHQTIICTHPDGHNNAGNIHVHIVINSIRKLDVPFEDHMERPGDAKAGNKHRATNKLMEYLKQETMTLCQREEFYQVDLLSPAKIRITDREYWAQRKGQATLDKENQIKIASGIQPDKTTYETEKGFLRKAIQNVASDSDSLEKFTRKLFEQYGITVHESRGRISYELPNRTKPIRGRTLGTDFEKESLLHQFANNHPDLKMESKSSGYADKKSHNSHSSDKIHLILDIENNIKAQQNRFYAQKIKISNLKQLSKTLAFLKDNRISSVDELESLLSYTAKDMQEKHSALKDTEDQLRKTNLLIRYSGQHLANKQTYGQYLKAKNKQKFRESHTAELMLYETARKELKTLTGGQKVPSLKQLKKEKETLTQRKNLLYEDYSYVRSKLKELQTVHSNVQNFYDDNHQKTSQRSSQIR